MRATALLLPLLGLSHAPESQENLLRNGSFEGGLLYWHGIDPAKHRLVSGDARVGPYALRIEKGYVMSAPFVARRGQTFTVSLWARGERNGEIHVQMPPSAREEGQRAKRLWCREGTKVAPVTNEWRRLSFTWPADVPPSGFWPEPHYMVLIGANDSTPLLVDGVTVTAGDRGTEDYVPRREVEIVADCPELPGYEGPRGNFLDRGTTVRLTAHVSHAAPRAREVTVRWQFIDYEGILPLGAPVERKAQIPPGGTIHETASLTLPATGTILARLSVLSGSTVIDSSDFPLTALPYPKAAAKPDWRERFGGSFAGALGCVQRLQRLGFGWIRWRPHMNGEDHLPKDPKGGPWEWRWFDRELDEQETHGFSTHCVLYPPPKWIMEKGHPLPRDMRWPADDPRWDDLSVETTWDRFVRGVVDHYRGRSLVYEIENEPEFDGWDTKGLLAEYAKFTIRTARLIKTVDPQAKVMVNNVYGIPSRVNAALFKAGGLRFIDVISWHDYHAGWLADAPAIRRMRQNLDEAGGRHVQIWFNEGWAFTNTAVDEPPACTGLTSAQSLHAIVDSVAELTVNGQEKTILFHTAYEKHGMSFWDYSGPGTMLWDWYNFPLPIAAAWNVLNHHIGLSEPVGFVRPPGCNFCIFQDLRNGRGVAIAYADRDAKVDVAVDLPEIGSPLTAEDIMGNASPAPKRLVLPRTGRPVILYSAAKTPGRIFLEKLQPLDRRHRSFAIAGGTSWSLPPSWEGREKGSPDGSVAFAGGRPIWRLEQIWPPDWTKKENFRHMVWTGTDWNVKEGGFGGQPGAALQDSALVLSTRAPHGRPPQARLCGLTFTAPRDGAYALSGTAECRIWDGKNRTTLRLLLRRAGEVAEAGKVVIPHGGRAPLDSLSATLAAGEEFTLLPQIEGMFAGGHCILRDLQVTLEAGGIAHRLPASWEGTRKGTTEGNPFRVEGRALWRIDRVHPDRIILAENYAAVPWDGTAWRPLAGDPGGPPSVRIEAGKAHLSVAGPSAGADFQRIAGIVFLVPEGGVWNVRATARTRPSRGAAKIFRLAVMKKDTQRAAEVKSFDLPPGGSPVALDFEVELTAGHELVFLPLMPERDTAATTTLEGLSLRRVK